MRYHIIARYIGIVLLINAAFMLVSAVISFSYGVDTAFYPLLLSGIITGAIGGFPLIFVGRTQSISTKESYCIVVGSWLIACLFGTFPYLLWGGEFDVFTAWFESVSGFTTTGSTALTDVEALPHGLLFWRSSTHWLGGIGVVMFALVILPVMGRTKMTLYSVELSPLARDNYKYRAQKLVRILVSLYLGMTVLSTVLLRISGMPFFDAVNHSFSVTATGGFSIKNASIGFYDNAVAEIILIFFMTLSSIHFGLIFATITGKHNNILRSEVTRFFLATLFFAGLLVSINLFFTDTYQSWGEALRNGFFHTVSNMTTTGFSRAQTNLWPSFSILLLIFVMFQCGCAGSTTGGIKSDRVWLALKVLKAKIMQQQHPNAVVRLKLNNIPQDDSVINFAMFFIVVYLLLVLVGTLIVTATGLDLLTGFSLILASMSNVGPGFGAVDTVNEFSQVTPFIKTISTIFMLLGRLEIFGFVQLFLLKWWR